jgi:hypothetical protein
MLIAKVSHNASSFEQVARLIAANESDVGWLAAGLRQWVWPQEGTPASLRCQPELGSGLIDHSQNMTAAAMQIAEK